MTDHQPVVGPVVDGRNDPRTAKGRERSRQIAAENAVEIERITADLIAGLGRPANGAETIAAETIAVTVVKARRLRERFHDDSKERRLLGQLMRTTPFGMVPAPPPVPAHPGREG